MSEVMTTPAQSDQTLLNPPDEKIIYMLTSDSSSGNIFTSQIGHFGYNVYLVKTIQDLENIAGKDQLKAVLVDIPYTEASQEIDALFEQIKPLITASVPLVFLSNIVNQEVRLKAVRAGGVAFFIKPVDMVNLVNRLDELYAVVREDAYRVLIIDDQITIANFYSTVLKMSGMVTDVLTRTEEVLQKIESFHPDLVLMDLHMPGCNGIELAKMIRQIDHFVDTPIVFLSSEEDFSKKMEAMRIGSDDFLTKPIKSTHLIALIRSRLDRSRILRSFMIRDSLTGLLNHTAFYGQMDKEINRCERYKTGLSLSMLDLDGFKLINDKYGHSTGNTVLKSLSLMLKQRLRRSDIIGRFGGEEFIVAFPETSAESAWHIMNEIRQNFADIRHITPDNNAFSVTFSCGISTYPEYTDASSLVDAADMALYIAKHTGRNRIIVAPLSKSNL
jgi:diguanylate cyclase (GGDEF)-like protein